MAIAIIGMGARLPGEASTPEAFWDMLLKARSAKTKVPTSRYNVDAHYHPDPDRLGSVSVEAGHFLEEDPYAFDAPFFSMKPKEAQEIDPQQRMLLEVTYQAIENAGLQVESFMGSNTSCFVGSYTGDYRDALMHDNEGFGQYSGAGLSPSLVSNRVSWFFDLKGPSMTIDTACSSSLTSFHLACQSIRNGESEMSIAAGTNLNLGPDVLLLLSAAKVLSPDGTSKAFDHRANGFGRGEGLGVMVLKSLDAAIRDGNTIRAVVLATATNHDGRTQAISHPSSKGQAALIRAAYQRAGVPPSMTGYFEAHGTGTEIGDPLEMSAITEIFGPKRTEDLFVGSVKTNVGHLEAASGITGLMKAVLIVERGLIPPNLWFEALNPRIVLPEHIKIATQLTAWTKPGARIASVNSFGFGGANAHCIVQDAFHYLQTLGINGVHCTELTPRVSFPPTNGHDVENKVNGTKTNGTSTPKLLVVSAQDRQGTMRVAEGLALYLDQQIKRPAPTLLDDLVFTLGKHRSSLPWKSFALGSSLEEIRQSLETIPVAVRSSREPRLAFVFTGQGAQWHAMGRELFVYDVFRESLKECEEVLRSVGCPWSLKEEMHRAEADTRLDAAGQSQPVCTCLQVGLVDLLRDWGVQPAAVVGHSSGEIAAAYAAGIVSRRAAVKLAWHRGRFATVVERNQELSGTMIAVRAGADRISPLLNDLTRGTAVVACYNSPANCTVSGNRSAIEELKSLLPQQHINFTELKIGVAYHSSHMETVADAYLNAILDEEDSPPVLDSVPLFSSVTGEVFHKKHLDAQYWVKNLVSSVRFTTAVQNLLRYTSDDTIIHDGPTFNGLVEIGPHSALRTYLGDICKTEAEPVSLPYVTLLRRGHDALQTALTAAGEIWCLGSRVNLGKVNVTGTNARMLVDLPPYPFNHSISYHEESNMGKEMRLRSKPRTDLLGYPFPGSPAPLWRNFLRVRENPWMADHKVQGAIIFPGAGFLVMAIEAIHQLADPGEIVTGFDLRDVVFHAGLRVPETDKGVEVMTEIRAPSESAEAWSSFKIVARSEQDNLKWQTYCEGWIRLHNKSQSTPALDVEVALEHQSCAEALANSTLGCKKPENSFYEDLEEVSVHYGPTFRGLRDLLVGQHAGRASVQVPNIKGDMPRGFAYPHVIHPATLDSLIQMLFPAIKGDHESPKGPVALVSLDRLHLSTDVPSQPGQLLETYSTGKQLNSSMFDVSIGALDSGTMIPVIAIQGLGVTVVSAGNPQRDVQENRCFGTTWSEDVELLNQDQLRKLVLSRVEPDGYGASHYQMLDLVCLSYLRPFVDWLQGEGRGHAAREGLLKLFYEWMMDKLREHEQLVKDPAALAANAAEAVLKLKQTEAGSVTVELITRIGRNLQNFYCHSIEPLQVMLEGGLLYDYYRVGLGTSFNDSVAEYMGMLGHKSAGQLSILEVGGGTGGTTRRILNRLRNADGTSMASRYVFTDISPGFLGNAAKNFAHDGAIMEFKTLNIENDPLTQGFEPESFDVLVAANVLHATESIHKTLLHCRSLLKKNGRLVLAELTEDPVFPGFLMGALPGWWLGEDDGRKGGPALTIPGWHKALLASGFSGVDTSVRGDGTSFENPCSLLVSARVDNAPEAEAETSPGPLQLIVSNGRLETLCASLTEKLASQNHPVTVVPFSSVTPTSVQHAYCICLVEVETPLLMDISEADFTRVKHLLYNAAGVCWVTRGAAVESTNPQLSLMTGLFRTVVQEENKVNMMMVDLDSAKAVQDDDSLSLLAQLVSNHLARKLADYEYAIRDGLVHVPRIVALPDFDEAIGGSGGKPAPIELPYGSIEEPAKLTLQQPRVLDSLCFERDDTHDSLLSPDCIEIEVHSVGMNPSDVLVTTGKIAASRLGVECSGVVTRLGRGVQSFQVGDRVVGLGWDCFAKHVRLPAEIAIRVPHDMTLEDAASLMVSWLTAYYALSVFGRLQRGESLLIHSAASATGQAAVRLAQKTGAEVYCTVGSETDKALLIDEYGVPEVRILSDQGHGFSSWVMRATGNKGVDAVLNTLSGEALRLSWNCLADFGRFLDISGLDKKTNSGLDMRPFVGNRTFSGINVLDFIEKPGKARLAAIQGVAEMLGEGVAKAPKPVTVTEIGKIREAFLTMQSGQYVGKVVIRMAPDSPVPYSPPPIRVRPDATYVMAGGVGGVGREITQWLIANGAKHLLLLSRSAASNAENQEYTKMLRTKYSVEVAAYDCDITVESEVERVLNEAQQTVPPIKGVIIGALVLQDALFEKMTLQQWHTTLRTKVHGSYNLHVHLPKQLDFFVMLSSVLGVIGFRGQANYQAGNVFQDALAQHRVSQGLNAFSVDIGAVTGVGVLAHDALDKLAPHLRIAGIQSCRVDQISSAIGMGSRTFRQAKQHGRHTAVILGLPASRETKYYWMNSARFGNIIPPPGGVKRSAATTNAADTRPPLREELAQASSLTAAVRIATARLSEWLMRLMAMPSEDIDSQKPLTAYGVDSLVAVELRSWILKETGYELSVFDITRNAPMIQLGADIAKAVFKEG